MAEIEKQRIRRRRRGGARNRDVQKFSGNAFPFNEYSVDALAKLTSWELTVIQGVREEECVALYRETAVELTR